VKALAIAQKDIKRLLKSLRFFFSIILSSLVALGILLFSRLAGGQQMVSGVGMFVSPSLLIQLVFTFTLPGLILAVLISHSDILSRERSEGTILTLFSQPVSNMAIIFGKFLTMGFTSLVFSLLNVLLLGVALSSLGIASSPLGAGSLLASFFFAALLFQLSIGGLALLFSSIFKRSFMVLVAVILVHAFLVIIYSSQLTLSISASPGSEATAQAMESTLKAAETGIKIVFMLFGIILGYAIVSVPNTMTSSLPSNLSSTQLVKVVEPPVFKFMPINVNAQRLLYFLTSPNPQIEILEPVASVLGLVGITALWLFLSLLIIRRARMECQE